MQFTFKQSPTGYDVPLASIRVQQVMSSDAVQIIDMSQHIPGNPITPVSYVNSYPSGSGEIDPYCLVSENIYGSVEISDEYAFDPETGRSDPLWYAHVLRNQYANSRASDRVLYRTIRTGSENVDRKIIGLIPEDGDYILVRGSVAVSLYTGGSYVELDPSLILVEHAEGYVLLPDTVVGGEKYRITYTLLPIDIRFDRQAFVAYRVEACLSAPGAENSYLVAVLSSSQDPIIVTYSRSYSANDVKEIEEHTASIPLYTLVNETERALFVNSESFVRGRVYSTFWEGGRQYIRVPSGNRERKYSIRARGTYASRISLEPPLISGFTPDWYPRVRIGRLYSEGRYFSTEEGTQAVLYRRERARILAPDLIVVPSTDIIASISSGGRWFGVKAIGREDQELEIISVNVDTGLILLETEISLKDTIMVEFYIRNNEVAIRDVCLNPLDSHLHHNQNIRDYIVLYLLAENAYSDRDLPVYTKLLPKYVKGRPFTYTYDYIDSLLNSADAATRNLFRADASLPAALLGEDLVRIEPLGLAYVINPMDQDGYTVEDARLFGGGFRERWRHAYDFALFDGEACDLAAQLIVKVPRWMRDDLIARAKLYDPEVVASSKPDELAAYKTDRLIKQKVMKFSLLGTVQEIEYYG